MRMPVVAVFLLLAPLQSNAQAKEDVERIHQNKDWIIQLLRTNSVDSIRNQYSFVHPKEIVTDILYFCRLAEVSSSPAYEDSLLGLIPRSDEEFSYVYAITYRPLKDEYYDKQLGAFQWKFFALLGRGVSRNPKYLGRFFRLGSLLEGDPAYVFEGQCRDVMKGNPKTFFLALSRENSDIQNKTLIYLTANIDEVETEYFRKHKWHIPRIFWRNLGID